MRMLIAGGGTGGHLYPGLALAEEIRARGGEVSFVGTEKGIEVRAVPKANFPLELITVSGLKRMGLIKTISGLAKLPVSFAQCHSIISRFKPDLVVGVGGYASGPMVLTAWMRGIPTAILEQNSIPGMTNKVLGKFVKRIFATFEKARPYFPTEKFVRAGNPIRAALLKAPKKMGDSILILGGSQGARALNETLPEALKSAFSTTKAIPVTHQTGEKDVESTRARYQAAGVDADVKSFIDDMGHAYANARFCVCRAGASTCTELTALGKPSILIPFQFAADDHQTHNARELEEAGAAIVIAQPDATASRVSQSLVELLQDDARIEKMSNAATGIGRPKATQEIVDALYGLAGVSAGAASEVRP